MKNLYSLLFCSLLFAATGVNAQTWPCGATGTDNVTATLTDGTLAVSGTGDMKNFVVAADPPASDVPWWDKRASITRVTIAAGVTSIGNNAFRECNIASVTIPDGVKSIGEYAFRECTELTSATIPGSVTEIGYGAFRYCSGLVSLTIPGSVTSIDGIAFQGCTGLASVTVKWDTPLDGISTDAFENCRTAIVKLIVPQGKEGVYAGSPVWKDFYIEGFSTVQNSGSCGTDLAWEYDMNGTLTISGYGDMESYDGEGNPAPWNDFISKIYTLVLPGGEDFTSIGKYAFASCTRLTSATIPNGVTNIGQFAFAYCNGLTAVNIPGSVVSIDGNAFRDCGLTSVIIPGKVKYIGDRAFYNCTKLASVTVEWTDEDDIADISDLNVFGGVGQLSLVRLYVPAGMFNTYKAAPVWGDFNIVVTITGIILEKSTLTLTVGKWEDLKYTVEPGDADKNVTWESSDNNVATVSANGRVTAVNTGSAAIVVKSVNDDTKTATCAVTVTQATSAEIIGKPLARIYPNPTDGLLILHFGEAGTYGVAIATVTGAILLRQTVSDQMKQIDISSYPVGVYLLLIDDGKRQSVIKIQKK